MRINQEKGRYGIQETGNLTGWEVKGQSRKTAMYQIWKTASSDQRLKKNKTGGGARMAA